jgi:hypothetical protein|eukprot:g688.t1
MASFTGSTTRGKVKTKNALKNFTHDGGHSFGAPPTKEKKKTKRQSVVEAMEKAAEIAKAAGKTVKKHARASITMMKEVAQERRASMKLARTGEPGPLSSLLRDLEVDESGTLIKAGLARVFLVNTAVHVSITFDQYTVIGEMNMLLKVALKIPFDGVCGVVQYGFGNYLPLDEDVRIVDVMADWPPAAEIDGSCRLVYQQNYYLPSGPFDNMAIKAMSSPKGSGSHRLKYLECCHRISNGMYSLSVKRAIKCAALQIIALRLRGITGQVKVRDVISPAIMDRFGHDSVERDVLAEVNALSKNQSALSVELELIEMVEDAVAYYGASMFAVKVMTQDSQQQGERSPPKQAMCAVSNDGIYLLSGWNLTFSEYYPFSNILQWTVAPNPNLFAFVVQEEIKFLVYDYPEAIQKRVQDSISALMEFHNGNSEVMAQRDKEDILRLKNAILREENVVEEPLNAEIVAFEGADFFEGKAVEPEMLSNPLRGGKRGSVAMTAAVSSGKAIGEVEARQIQGAKSVQFGSQVKSRNGAPPPPPPKKAMKAPLSAEQKREAAKNRRMSALRALKARRDSKAGKTGAV